MGIMLDVINSPGGLVVGTPALVGPAHRER